MSHTPDTTGNDIANVIAAAFSQFAERITRLEEELEDLRDALEIKQAIERGEETIPAEMMHRLAIAKENPVKVWREHRKLTQSALAKLANVSQATIAEIESGRKKGSVDTLQAIARALKLDLDDILP